MIKRNSLILTFLFIIILAAGELYAQGFTEDEKAILELQDKRTLGKEHKLLVYLRSSDEQTLSAALTALANIADTNTTDKIGELLINSKSAKVRSMAAFALGEIAGGRSTQYLLKALETEKDNIVLIEILNNIGRTGDEEALNKVIAYSTGDDGVRSAIAMSISRLGVRKIRNASAIEKLRELSASIKSDELRKVVAYAFNRAGDKSLLPAAKNEIENLISSNDYQTRMWAYLAYGRIPNAIDSKTFAEWLNNEADWHVKVCMILALNNITGSEVDTTLFESLVRQASEEPNPHIAITAMQTLVKLYSVKDKNSPELQIIKSALEWILIPNKAVDWQIKAEAIKTLASLFKDEYKDALLMMFSRSENYDLKAEVVRSFQYMDNAMVYRELRDSITADVWRYNAIHPNKDGSMIGSADLAKIYKAFVDCLTVLGPKMDADNQNNVRLIFSEFMGSKNPAIVDACMTSLQDSVYSKYLKETKQIILFDYPELKYPSDYDVMLIYIQAMGSMKIDGAKDILIKNLTSENYDFAKASADALKSITGKDYEKQITAKKFRTDFDWDFLQSFEDFKTATIHTTQGDIKIRLLYHDAPFTAMNFVKLARKHYFDNTIFHRVVPNFVIQGGDPTGTGFGGPGYSIRSEFTPLSYETGMVGMASGGKDTEGSQFFITHSPQYHLDGKYTIFGKVVEGIDVVDRIQIGDSILNITFSSI